MAIVRSAALAGACTVLLAACAAPGPTASAAAGSGSAQTLRWTIGPAFVDCVGVAPTFCLEYRDAPDGPWKRFHGVIEGFEFRPGHETDILVRQEPIPRPPADAPSHRTILVREIERRPLSSSSLPAPLAGTAWQLVAMPGAELAPAGARGPLTLGFDAAGRVAGMSGVNRYGAHVDAGPGWLRVGGAMSTRMAGPPEAMALESEFLSRLQRAGGWRIDGDRLRLLDAKGLELMTLRRAAPGSAS
jgi:heat shock protein HslJ